MSESKTQKVQALVTFCSQADGVGVVIHKGERLPVDHPAIRERRWVQAIGEGE
jgi:hypothetical protein